MNRKIKQTIKDTLTVFGWIAISFAVIALIMFIIKSGVL